MEITSLRGLPVEVDERCGCVWVVVDFVVDAFGAEEVGLDAFGCCDGVAGSFATDGEDFGVVDGTDGVWEGSET